MKKTLLFFALLSVFTLAFAENNKAIMMQSDGSLYTTDEDGSLVWNMSISTGVELTILEVKDEKGKMILDEISTTRKVSGKKDPIPCKAYHVSYNNNQYYVLSDRVSLKDSYAFVSTETALYRSPDYADVYDSTLQPGTFVAYDKTQLYIPTEGKLLNSFRKAYYFDYNSYTIKSAYIFDKNLSLQKDDLKTLQVLAKLESDSINLEAKKELVKNINNLSVSPGIKILLTDAWAKVNSANLSDANKISVNKYMQIINDDDSLINIRSFPGTEGQVIAQVDTNCEPLNVISRTEIKGFANNTSNYWYEVEIPEEDGSVTIGWIYGDFLE